MAYKHIFLPPTTEAIRYKSRQGFGPVHAKRDDLATHIKYLIDRYKRAFPVEPVGPRVVFGRKGVFLTFSLSGGCADLATCLESERSGIQLRTIITNDHGFTATVFIPTEKRALFLNRLERISDRLDQGEERPRDTPLFSGVEDIKTAVVDSFWQDEKELMPGTINAEWCEVWLQRNMDATEVAEFGEAARRLEVECREGQLIFPERVVLLCKATRRQLTELICSCTGIAEFRRFKETSRYFIALSPRAQGEWARELDDRVNVTDEAEKTSVCVLDTGANNGHLLLRRLLSDDSCLAAYTSWSVADLNGHGTNMCGTAAYGDLATALQSNDPIVIRHVLESVKIMPREGNDKRLYGVVTEEGIYRAEIAHPNRKRVLCMAVTENDERLTSRGVPSSWSAKVDQILFADSPEKRRLMLISAGNAVWDHALKDAYPNHNMSKPVENPGQSWNALTIGAYTMKDRISDPNLAGYGALAKIGELSPQSSTSLLWQRQWPIKPDVVMEGGNMVAAPNGTVDFCDDVSLLTTSARPEQRMFDCHDGTSAATALASKLAAEICAAYPNAWPETIRGLMVHSARWTDAMMRQFCDGSTNPSKTCCQQLVRICGYGIPDRERALYCSKSALTMIAESELQPFRLDGTTGKMNKMHCYTLPWPREKLLELGAAKVVLRVTLSYYIEPSPGERGWLGKYRYASHGLRFAVNSPLQSKSDFLKKVNLAVERAEDDDSPGLDSDRWKIGRKNDTAGSVHSDFMCESAQDLAECNLVAVYPIIGWWRERPKLNKVESRARYSLIVSLETTEISVDIYTPVSVKVGVPVPVEIDIN